MADVLKREVNATWSLETAESYEDLHLLNWRPSAKRAERATLRQSRCEAANLMETELVELHLRDVVLQRCDLANAYWPSLSALVVELMGCQMIGFQTPEALLRDVRFVDCQMQLTLFRFAEFKSARFQGCDLREADFHGADLTGVAFEKCDLRGARLSHATLKEADLRTAQIEGIQVGPVELAGAIVNPFQAMYLASVFGLVVKDEHD